MGAVAIGTNCCALRAVLDRTAVNALLVGDEWLGTVSGGFHQELLRVAGAAGGGDVGVVDGRFRIACGQNRVGVAMAIAAGRGNAAVGLPGGRVVAMLVGGLRVGVALGAGDLCRRVLVRR